MIGVFRKFLTKSDSIVPPDKVKQKNKNNESKDLNDRLEPSDSCVLTGREKTSALDFFKQTEQLKELQMKNNPPRFSPVFSEERDFIQVGTVENSIPADKSRSIKKSHIKWETAYKSGIARVYNPKTGEVKQKTAYKSGIAGAYNPKTGEIEWKSSYKSGIAGVYNPKTGEVEWKSSYKSGIAGVYNPKTEEVEWKSSYKSGIAGVYNPKTEKVEWKTAYKSGVAGVYNPETEEVKWSTSYKSGVAVKNPEKFKLTNAYSFPGGGFDD